MFGTHTDFAADMTLTYVLGVLTREFRAVLPSMPGAQNRRRRSRSKRSTAIRTSRSQSSGYGTPLWAQSLP